MVDWYTQAEAASDVIRISEPHVNELLSANFWWLRGNDRDIVIDAGLGVVALREAIPGLFERDPMVLLTHAHLDHVGGAAEFADRAAHPAEAGLLAAGVPASLYGAELYDKLGIDAAGEPVPELMIDVLPDLGYDPATYRVEPMTLNRTLDDGDRIDLGGRALTVLHLPGHTPGSIALLEERTGTLYSGDIIYEGYLIDNLPNSDVADYRRSMEFLADLDVSVVHPGHGDSFGRTRLRPLAEAYLLRSSG
ncbi:MBL fold metallo-hydrolase [Micromonospora parathelypteridis]|uniref:Glyoxylase-like metal-dependent hydrolase (Beta-lactamase superfamily II) n=1 Tax=Micromonospora parathelypteridis TaxID=1839617 RepID=A0A840WEL8_9ACTN|nr:MBL fold metallo-hydrolase [Micromonospora parathelypteridis]MBB5481441.1 glyoxylase-like metal-dependent hydrolase (beta-lactamase superfamily II) [Micromonospora parathelypteridis]GGO18489.1 MBL fold metallo-hydrolase [Micromonospora parathelypteridis]